MNARKLFYVLLAIIALTIVGTGFIFANTQQRFNTSLEQIADKQAEIEIADEEYEQLRLVESQLENFDVDLEPFLPNAKGQTEALELVFNVFRDANIQIDGYNFTPTEGLPGETSQSRPSSAGNVLSLPLQLTPDSDNPINYQQLMDLLRGLEQSQRQLNINQLTINSTPANPDQPLGPRQPNLTIDVSVQYLDNSGGNGA